MRGGKVFALFLALILILGGCAPAQKTKSLSIAITGSLEVYNHDMSFLNGAQMAVEDANAEYGPAGFVVSSEFFDDGYDFEKGMLATNKIASSPAFTAVLGSHSFSVSEAAAPIFEGANKLLIASNSMMDQNIVGMGYRNIFRNTNGEMNMAKSLANYAKSMGTDRLAVCHSDTEFENNFINSFCESAEALGLSVLDYSVIVGSERDFDRIYRTWQALGINGVLVSRDAISDAFTLAQYIRARDPAMRIYGDFSFDAGDKLKEYQRYVEGVVIPVLVPIEASDRMDEFNRRYEARFGVSPTWWAAHGYSSLRMVVDTAVGIDSTDPADIAKELHRAGYSGILGDITFNEDGVLAEVQNQYMVVKRGELVELEDGNAKS